jgi:NitT/TauT family transport system ATP-binding protein
MAERFSCSMAGLSGRQVKPTGEAMYTAGAKLVVQNLSKHFSSVPGTVRPVLHDLNFEIRAGEFVCIVGTSGCGKTTFIRILDGLIESTSGQVLLDGQVITKPGPDRGFVFQQDSLLPWRSILDNVLFGLDVLGMPRKDSIRVAQELIGLVGLAGHEKQYPHELSGGMRQRVNLARALAVDPDILLMDEPFAALDAQTREVMQRELLRIWEKKKKTVIFITHQIDEAVYLADRVLVFGSRPGIVKDDIAIDLGRPRDLSLKRRPEFIGYVERISDLIYEEAYNS